MCGIAGTFNYRGGQVSCDALLRIREAMRMRGPDGAGIWFSQKREVGLAHRRLAIIDLSDGGLQPMASPDGNLQIVLNGEIYNHCVLREEMEARGWRFRNTSDTEVLLALYAYYGEGMLSRIRGMYAFAIWDDQKKEMFVARDPFGIKPLYYSENGNQFQFASQVKAMLAGREVDTSPNPAGHVGFLLWGSVPGPHTLYKGIHELPAGHWLRVRPGSGATKPQCFWNIAEELCNAATKELPTQSRLELLREALDDTVRHHMVSDVTVGLFLSAGLDSTTLLSTASGIQRNPMRAVTLAFKEYADSAQDEAPLARSAARQFHANHHVAYVSQELFGCERGRLLSSMDQPSLDGINTYFVSKVTAESGIKVALSGLGGDELFGGYPSFRDIPAIVNKMVLVARIPGLGKGFRMVASQLFKNRVSPKYAGLLEYGGNYSGAYLLRRGLFMPWELPQYLDAEMVREGWQGLQMLPQLDAIQSGVKDSHARVSTLELSCYMRNQLLRDSDWAGMAHGLEIRVPLVDTEFFRRIALLMSTEQRFRKPDLGKCLANPLPAEILNRPKTGFTVPVREWMQEANPSQERGLRGWALAMYRNSTNQYVPERGSSPEMIGIRTKEFSV